MTDEQREFLLKAQELRNTSDYGQFNAVMIDRATEQIDLAEKFLAMAIQEIGAV